MKTKILTSIVSLASLALVSCNDFLELTPTDKLTDKAAWEDTHATDLYINNFYEYLSLYGQFGNQDFNSNLIEGLTDALKYGSPIVGPRAGDSNYYVFTPETISGSGCMIGSWGDTYLRIRRINEFLDSMRKYSTYTPEINDRYEAQARFFRAFLYFHLAKCYGGSAILYTSLEQMKKDTPLSSPEQVWQQIHDDLTFAANILPTEWNSSNTGRVTKGAAYAMLSRAMLYAERWEDVKSACEELFKLNIYKLAPTYEEGYRGGNSESILEFAYDVTSPSHTWDREMAMYHEYTTGGSCTPTQEMVEEYESKTGEKVDWSAWHTAEGTTAYPPYDKLEPRFAATILYNGAKWQDKTVENCVNGEYGKYIDYGTEPYPYGKTVTGYYMRKLRQETNRDLTNVPSTHTWVSIRLAEVYLNYAEACYRLNNPSEAINYIRQIRDRVNLPTAQGLTGDALFEMIRHERKVELAYEGHLWWDMRRWKLAEKAYTGIRVHGLKITREGEGFRYTYVDCDGEDRTFLNRMYRLPIPDSELKNNSAVQQFDEWNF